MLFLNIGFNIAGIWSCTSQKVFFGCPAGNVSAIDIERAMYVSIGDVDDAVRPKFAMVSLTSALMKRLCVSSHPS